MKTCEQCGTEHNQKGNTRFCSRRCYSASLSVTDWQAMSVRTRFRRLRAAGLTSPTAPRTVDYSLFEKWSDDLAYFMGLVWTDGCLSRNQLSFSTKDKEQIETYSRLIGSEWKPLRGKYYSCIITAPPFLIEQGLTGNKSLTVKWPASMPDEHSAAFIRGVIDGDGSVSSRLHRKGQTSPDLKVSIYSASLRFIESLGRWHEANGISCSVYKRAAVAPSVNPLWAICVFRQDAAKRLYQLIYPATDVPCLGRKRKPFDAWIATPRGKVGRPFAKK